MQLEVGNITVHPSRERGNRNMDGKVIEDTPAIVFAAWESPVNSYTPCMSQVEEQRMISGSRQVETSSYICWQSPSSHSNPCYIICSIDTRSLSVLWDPPCAAVSRLEIPHCYDRRREQHDFLESESPAFAHARPSTVRSDTPEISRGLFGRVIVFDVAICSENIRIWPVFWISVMQIVRTTGS